MPPLKPASQAPAESVPKNATVVKQIHVSNKGRSFVPQEVPSKSAPKLVNRGASGLLTSVKIVGGEELDDGFSGPKLWERSPKDRIECDGTVVDLDSLVEDPDNARVHPEKNLAAVKDSLSAFGQRIALTVRAQDRKIAAGNGRFRAMKELGWTKCAASIRPMTDAEFAAFALADNRSAELAKWDFKTVARLDKIAQQAGLPTVGFTADELQVLRMADWTPPPVEGGEGYNDDGVEKPRPVLFGSKQYGHVEAAIARLNQTPLAQEDPAEALAIICMEWLAAQPQVSNG